MKSNVREMLKEFTIGMKDLGKSNTDFAVAFGQLLGTTLKPKKLSTKQKELISIGIAVHTRCEYCVVFHVHNAFKCGATRDEILEAAFVAVCMGGGPSMTYLVTLVKSAVDEFEKDFVTSKSESSSKAA